MHYLKLQDGIQIPPTSSIPPIRGFCAAATATMVPMLVPSPRTAAMAVTATAAVFVQCFWRMERKRLALARQYIEQRRMNKYV